MRASWSWEPRGTLTRWEPVPSFPFNVLMKVVNKSLFFWWSPKLTMSTLTFSFFKRFANLTISASSATKGEPMNKTIRILWFFPWRCFNTSWNEKKLKQPLDEWHFAMHTWAILMPVTRLTSPFGCTKCIFDMILPTSAVSVAKTSTVLKEIISLMTRQDSFVKFLTLRESEGQHYFLDSSEAWSCTPNWCHPSGRWGELEDNHHCVGNRCCLN